jgi:DNA topoisomerase-1
MAKFKVTKDDSGKHTWMAKGETPKTGKETVIRGGQTGTPVGKQNPSSEKSFDARHNATGMTPKKYINKLRWDNKAKFGTTVTIPDDLFGKASPKKGASTKTASKKTAYKKAAVKKTGTKKTASKKASRKKGAAAE